MVLVGIPNYSLFTELGDLLDAEKTKIPLLSSNYQIVFCQQLVNEDDPPYRVGKVKEVDRNKPKNEGFNYNAHKTTPFRYVDTTAEKRPKRGSGKKSSDDSIDDEDEDSEEASDEKEDRSKDEDDDEEKSSAKGNDKNSHKDKKGKVGHFLELVNHKFKSILALENQPWVSQFYAMTHLLQNLLCCIV